MVSWPRLAALAAWISAAIAATPSGFTPSSSGSLVVGYAGKTIVDGEVLARDATQAMPVVGTSKPLRGRHALFMIDLDIPTDGPPRTSTLLHWMQTGLSSSATAAALHTANGSTTRVFTLTNTTAPSAPYIGPNPPARIPLWHRYTFLLVDTNDAAPEQLQAVTRAAASRQGFDANAVLTAAGLQDKVVAGTFFIVANPGPVEGTPGSNGTIITSTALPGLFFSTSPGVGQVTTSGGPVPNGPFSTSTTTSTTVTIAAPGSTETVAPSDAGRGRAGYSMLGLVVAAGVAMVT